MKSHCFSYKDFFVNEKEKIFFLFTKIWHKLLETGELSFMVHPWDPSQYAKFEKERSQPFFDLLQLIHPMAHPRILDLGCGNGALTKIVHDRLHASYTLGIDSSKEMLERAYSLHTAKLHFEEREIQTYSSEKQFDLIISNAVLHWIPEHACLFRKFVHLLAPGGQIAFQMPSNQNSLTHEIAAELAQEEPFKESNYPPAPRMQVLSMEDYAYMLEKLGFESQNIRLQLYTHFLESTASLVEWVNGSLLTYYKSYLPAPLYDQFVKEYQKRLIERHGWSEPFFFIIKRLLIWGQLPYH